jgi:hypothetical protein
VAFLLTNQQLSHNKSDGHGAGVFGATTASGVDFQRKSACISVTGDAYCLHGSSEDRNSKPGDRTMFQQLAKLQQVTLAARAATGLRGLNTEVSRGKVRVVLVTAGKKASVVDPLSEFLTIEGAIGVLEQITADKGFH